MAGLGEDRVIGPYLKDIRRLALRYHIESLRLFGSVARREATPNSDVDLLYIPTRPITLLDRIRFRMELEKLLGRRVDLCREEELKWSVKPEVMAEAMTL
ncbi:MAG: nucleotidyltransferase domain-containing protein [Thermoplasmata archaeon]|nr:nucleotidyltransferase domain-containing protein [Thermoplasmata archaeon]